VQKQDGQTAHNATKFATPAKNAQPFWNSPWTPRSRLRISPAIAINACHRPSALVATRARRLVHLFP
jgi:hypothetical protein